MNRKFERLAAKLAFDEMDHAQAEKLRQNLASDPEAARKLGEYEGLRADLKTLGERTPECSVSTARLRDAILGEGLNKAARPRQAWTWVWAPVATGVAAFAFMNWGRGPVQSPSFVENRPAYATTTGDLATPDVLMRGLNVPGATTPTAGVERKSKAASANRNSRHGRAKEADPYRHLLAVSVVNSASGGDPIVSDEYGAGDSATTKPLAKSVTSEGTEGFTAGPESAGGGDRVVLIEGKTNKETGAPEAQEVESFANVPVGG